MRTVTKSEQAEAIERLRTWIKPGDTVYTILRHRSSSGMSRSISLIGFGEDRRDLAYSWNVAKALGYGFDDRREGVRIGGCGMDMGFALVYELGRVLFPDGFACIGENCQSNDHANGDRDFTPGHVTHTDGGYALRQRWL